VIKELFTSKELFEEKKKAPPAVVFFYFDFTKDQTYNSVDAVLRCLILQLSMHSPYHYKVLRDQYKSSNGQMMPGRSDLLSILERLLREIGRTYIVLDALDECDADNVDRLVDLVSTLRAWKATPLHLFMTSQTRPLFTDKFKGINRIALEADVTREDIERFITSELGKNSKLKRWLPYEKDVVQGITLKSDGM
jgi:hypothetical protein